jgi:two-component system, sensor histidine kinase and response regulator
MVEPPSTRLLVVEDEVHLVKALQSTLCRHGYEVTGATTGVEAMEILRRQPFDLLLTDLHLPDMDGVAFLRQALAHDPTLIGIMMTGQGTIDSAVEAMKAGALDYILKPFKLSMVLAVLSRAADMRRLRRDNEELQRRLQRRTEELEATNKELEAFSYSVSHDLRGPLRAIEGFVEILVDELPPGNEQLCEYATRIANASRRMAALIDDLLRLARTARAEVRREPVDLAAFARETVAKLEAEAPDRAVEWVLAGSLRAKADPGLIRVVIENLLSNAWKYTSRQPRARIELGTEQRADDGLLYYVRDNGVGFDMQYASQIFRPFQRLHSASQFPGTGVGLATVQRIVHKHGGRIWAEAAPEKGAKFCFTLPS